MDKIDNKKVSNDEINLIELFQILFAGKWLIIGITSITSVIAIIYSLSLPNIYKSETLLTPVTAENSLSGAMQSFGGLASLAGGILPTDAADSNAAKAIEKVSSLSFFVEKIMPNIFLPDLMAAQSWNSNNGKLIYDPEIYDISSGSWVREVEFPMQPEPTPQESYRSFTSHLDVKKDLKTGFITISIEHLSPIIAKEWLEVIVKEINAFYREKDKTEAEASVRYLAEQISKTGYTEIKQVIANLAQRETQKLTLIEANEFYVFDYIDPPAIMERKSKPVRSVICIIGALIGGIIGVIVVLIRFFKKTS